MPKLIDLTGRRFGRLVVLGRAPQEGRRAKWFCLCDCGIEKIFVGEGLKCGDAKSCGCFRKDVSSERSKTHGHAGNGNKNKKRTYRIWAGMLTRCTNPNVTHYEYYGGRGISVHPSWKSYEIFLEDMGECPDGLSLDRIDNNGNYGPDNCRWATALEQARNRTHVKQPKAFGTTLYVKEWSELLGVALRDINAKLAKGEDFEMYIIKKKGIRYVNSQFFSRRPKS